MGNVIPLIRSNAHDFVEIDTLSNIDGIDGDVNVHVHNKNGDGGTVLAVHGSENFKTKEWKSVGDLLRKVHDLEMYVVDASEGPCGDNNLRIQDDDTTKSTKPDIKKVMILLDFLLNDHQVRYKDRGLLLFGEGWGSEAIVKLASKDPQIKALILANCTAGNNEENILMKLRDKKLPILFLYHADDPKVTDVKIDWAKVWDGDKNIQFLEVKKSDLTAQDDQNEYVMSQPFLWPILKFMKEEYIVGPTVEQKRQEREEDEPEQKVRLSQERL